MPRVYFYLNEGDYNRVKGLSAVEDFTLRHPQLVWSWGTYLRLKNRGYEVELTHQIPKSGILVMPCIYPAVWQKPPDDVLMICTLADSPPLLYLQVNVTQNPSQASEYPNLFRWPVWRHIPHWPQPGIKPRAEERGERFERIAFFGHRDQLEPQLASAAFQAKLKEMELTFEIREKDFTDYSDVDAVIAIRSFSGDSFLYKPATKLVNGWMGKTPVIAGAESAFAAIRKSDLDYLQATNLDELFAALQRLKDDRDLRRRMVVNGLQRANEFDDDRIAQQWERLLFTDAPKYLADWRRMSPLQKRLFYLDVFLSRSVRALKNKVANRLCIAFYTKKNNINNTPLQNSQTGTNLARQTRNTSPWSR